MTHEELCAEALKARKKAYTPYSHFAVGAALLTEEGKVYRGCNIENAAYSPTNCAERTAIFKAVSEGKRHFKAIAICGAPETEAPSVPCPPCAVCRQVMSEFCKGDFEIILYADEAHGGITVHTLDELLPMRFDLKEF